MPRLVLLAAVLREGPAAFDEGLAVAAAPIGVGDVVSPGPTPARLVAGAVLRAGARAFRLPIGLWALPAGCDDHQRHQGQER